MVILLFFFLMRYDNVEQPCRIINCRLLGWKFVFSTVVFSSVVMLASDLLHPHRSQHSADHRTEDDTADDRSQHSAEHRFAMMIMMLPRGQRGAAYTPGPGTDCN